MSPLIIIMGLPLIIAGVLTLVPADKRAVFRWGAILSTLASLLLAIYVFAQFDAALAASQDVDDTQGSAFATLEKEYGYAFTQHATWIDSLNISFHVGVDGIGVVMILMASIVAFAAACCAGEIKAREKEFTILLLLMTGGILGAFMSLDIFQMYFLHELALVPTFIMIGVWGRGENRDYAAYKITLYLSLGALIALAGLILLYLEFETFSLLGMLERLPAQEISAGKQNLIFALLLFGLGILVSLWPFHTWAPLGYAAAPTPTAMMHAGVIKKFGLFMLIRVALPLLPEGAQTWLPVLAWLCLGNILYCGLVAMRQKDLNQLIGNSSVAHMGFVFLGIASLTTIGLTGAVMVMFAHGLLAALAFGLSGYLHTQTRTLDMEKVSGLLRGMPFWGTAMIIALLAGCGLPGFANFAGEITVFFGAWSIPPLEAGQNLAHPLQEYSLQFRVVTIIAIWSALVIGAVYMLRAIRNLLHGEPEEDTPKTEDITHWKKLPYALLIGMLLLFGFYPKLLTEKINTASKSIQQAVQSNYNR